MDSLGTSQEYTPVLGTLSFSKSLGFYSDMAYFDSCDSKCCPRKEEKFLFNGQRAAFLDMIKTTQQDSLRVMDAVRQNLQRELTKAPKGIRL